tara:strand:+ start:56627 stop:56947 length:321 start_codon:yes stop_codon:yes gene_type:complete
MKRYVCLLLFAAALAPPYVPAFADNDEDDHQRDRLNAAVERGEIMRLSEILEKIGPYINGKILEIELEYADGVPIYEFYFLDSSGRRLEYEVDARTARILRLEDED